MIFDLINAEARSIALQRGLKPDWALICAAQQDDSDFHQKVRPQVPNEQSFCDRTAFLVQVEQKDV